MNKWLRRTALVLAVGYLAALLVVLAFLRFCGERWWPTAVALYLPRIGFGLPLPFIVLLLLVAKMRRLLWTQLAAGLVVLFPLMGLTFSWPRSHHEGTPAIRLLSFNVDSGYFGNDKVDAQIQAYSPDIVLLQEVELEATKLKDVLRSRYLAVEASTQFIIASRFPIVSVVDPDRLAHYGRMRSPRFLHYVIESPLGPIAVYNVHPVSPRGAFYELRGKSGLRREILSGRIFSGAAAPDFQENNALREEQIQAVSTTAASESQPVIIAGDTNLPGLSPIFAHNLSRYQDGFSKVGTGFGYTFQSYRPWMRLDRILASDELRFTHFEVGCAGASDHLCVVADLEAR